MTVRCEEYTTLPLHIALSHSSLLMSYIKRIPFTLGTCRPSDREMSLLTFSLLLLSYLLISQTKRNILLA